MRKGFEDRGNHPRVPRFSAGQPGRKQIAIADIFASIITVLFGAVHCFAWHFYFPSGSEQLLWRIAAVLTTALPIGLIAIFVTILLHFDHLLPNGWFDKIGTTLGDVIIVIVPIYLIGRIILLVLAFTSLRSLPAAAYETVRWTTFIPHV